MSSGQSGISKKQLNTTNQLGQSAQSNANSIYGNLQPFFQQEMTNPTAVAAPEIAAGGQAIAGSVAGANEAASLEAARTRNPAGLSANIDEAARQGGRQQSQNILGETNAIRQAGAQGQQGLYGTNIGETEAMYGLGPSTIKAGQVPTWWQNLLGAVQGAGGQATQSYANLGLA